MNTKGNRKTRNLFRAVVLAAAVALIFLLGVAPVAMAQTRTDHARLSAQVVNDGQRVNLSGATPLVARYGHDNGRLSSGEQLRMKLVLRRGATEKAALQDFLAQVQSPASSTYHKWLTPEAFGNRFGASDEDISAVTAWLQQQGLVIDGISKSRTVISFSGTEAQFESAFHAEMHRYVVNGETRVANSSTPSVPAALSPAIVGIATLGNAKFRPAHTEPALAVRTASGGGQKQSALPSTAAKPNAVKPQFTTEIGGYYYPFVGPADFGEIYGVKSLWSQGLKGAGQSVAIVAESNISRSDVDAFRKAFGLPETKLNVIVIGDDPGLDTTGAEGEAALDVQWAGALAPEADINLLVAASTNTQTGILVAAEYAIDHNLSPVLDVSWGACELGLQESGNQYFDDLWSQAAAQGISVMVASGDAGSAACDQGQYYANYGQQVNGIASTEYATAVGGTDLYGNADGATHWTLSNDPTTLQSVKSYITEAPWNDSCANPLVLQHAADFGLTETTTGQICSNEYSFLNTTAGGGGVSLCTSSDGATQSSCAGGHPAPGWQQGFAGIDANGKRHLPDVSFFSGAGLWGSAYAFCESDATTDVICVNDNGTMSALAAGGTSFAAPAFAGVVALLNQQQGGRQGNVNKYLYALAAKQFADPTLAVNCQSGSGNDSSACIFHDTVTGSISVPCAVGTLVDLTSGATCVKESTADYNGVTPGYVAGVGYDLATGLGSLNVANLFANWSSAVSSDSASLTTHSVTSATSVTYGASTSAEIDVKAASGSTVPTGSVSLLAIESDGSTLAVAANYLNNGLTQVSFNSLPPGSHQLHAVYGGDTKFGSSSSTPTAFAVTKAASAIAATASSSTVTAPDTATIVVKVQTVSTALNPSGSIVFTNQTTGAVLGSNALTAYTDPASGASWAQASFKVAASTLVKGDNVIAASYAGDGNYLAAPDQVLHLSYLPLYAVATSSSSLDINLGNSHQTATTVTISSNNGGKVDPNILSLSCEGIAVAGLTCSFSAPALDASGAVVSTLTLTANNPQPIQSATQRVTNTHLARGANLLMIVGATLLWSGRKRWTRVMCMALLALVFAFLCSCGGASHTASSTAVTNQLTVSSASPAYGSAVTLTSTLSPVDNKATPSGTVLFYDSSNLLGSAAVSGGKAVLTTSALSVGAHTLAASYSGDTTFMPSTSAAASVNVTLNTTVKIAVRDTAGNLSSLTLPVSIH